MRYKNNLKLFWVILYLILWQGIASNPDILATELESPEDLNNKSNEIINQNKNIIKDSLFAALADNTQDNNQPVKTDTQTINKDSRQNEVLHLLLIDRFSCDLKSLGSEIIKTRHDISNSPKDFFQHFKLGTYLYLLGDLTGAAKELFICVDLNSLPDCRAQLGKILELQGDHLGALQQFRQAVDLVPNSSVIHFLFAESLMHAGYMSDGINEYRRSISLSPSKEALAALSEALLASGDSTGAVITARQAITLDASYAKAQAALSIALLHKGDKISALRIARQAVLLNPNIADSHIALGKCLAQEDKLDGAIEEFKQAVDIDFFNPRAHNDFGYALYSKGEILPALLQFQVALRLYPNFSEAQNNLELSINSLTNK